MGHWGGGKGSCLHSYSWASIGTSLRCQCHSLWGERKEGVKRVVGGKEERWMEEKGTAIEGGKEVGVRGRKWSER